MALSSRATGSLSLGQKLLKSLSAYTPRHSGHEKLGLRTDDLFDADAPEVKEALRRLPENEQFLRLFRIKRALDLSIKSSELPKEQWTSPEQDIRYLLPYINQVEEELKERKEWNKL